MVGYHRDYLIESLYDANLFDAGYISYKQTPFEHSDDAISLQYLKDKKGQSCITNGVTKCISFFLMIKITYQTLFMITLTIRRRLWTIGSAVFLTL